MRILFIIAFLVASFLTLQGQDTVLFKSWVDNQGDIFQINDKQIIVDGPHCFTGTYQYKVLNDTLIMRTLSYWDDPRNKGLIFKISKLTGDSLMLKPLNNNAHTLFNTKSLITLVDLRIVKDDSFVFEKLYFSSSTCWGKCPALTIVIESNRRIKFISEKYTGVLKGSYKGSLTKKEYARLIEILKRYPVDSFPSNYTPWMDGQTHHLIIWHNGVRKEIHGSIDSQLTQDLIAFLITCHRNAILWPSFKKLSQLSSPPAKAGN